MNEKLNTESIRQLLNCSSAKLEQPALARLRAVRMKALARYDNRSTAPIFVLADNFSGSGHSSISHRSQYYWAFALLLAALFFGGVNYWQHAIEHDNSEVDLAILTDDLPIDAYVD